MNVNPTVEIIVQMSKTFERCSKELDEIAHKMQATEDITLAANALTCFSNCIMNLRLDLLISRPLYEYERKS